ncbi:5'-deoxynucleotidase [Pseudomaricurvus sp. HS19]|uniref:5'-deoxynucleotidase n=1 Tax=Pseudomaricurvus sp. HS19 TaxID=2692626 RepID=UPI00136A9BE6|nr:5'-deoxynucleotidase [Pseudomaricurvus sp. HS19]MYM62355.1 5'-deoxynucleotidase [Pseudomaricurvus sp. HS19]
MVSQFFRTITRTKWIERWSLHRNTVRENVVEHSWEAATIAHLLGVINNSVFRGDLNPERLATLALYHDCSESITGDLPTPIKYSSPALQEAYQLIEADAEQQLLDMLPQSMRAQMSSCISHAGLSFTEKKYLKAADSLSAFVKARRELDNGNQDYADTFANIRQRLQQYQIPEVEYFMTQFLGEDAINPLGTKALQASQ